MKFNTDIEFVKFSASDVITTSIGGKLPLDTRTEVNAEDNTPPTAGGWTNLDWNQ